MSLCQYSTSLGVPGQGAHSYRILNIAIVDVGLLLVFAVLVMLIFSCSFLFALLVSFIIGIICHRVFCVRTTIDQLLFP